MAVKVLGLEVKVDGLSKVTSDLTRYNLELQKATRNTNLFAEALRKLGIAKFSSAVGTAIRPINRLGDSFRNTFGITTAILVRDSIRGIINGIGNLRREAIEAISFVERLEFSFRSFIAREQFATGAADSIAEAFANAGDEATELVGRINLLAVQSPFNRSGLAEGFRTLLTGFQVEDSFSILRILTDFAAAAGLSTAKIQSLSKALADVANRGKLTGEEIRQFTNASVPVVQLLADEFEVTTGEIDKLVRKGLVPADVAIKTIAKSIATSFPNAAREQQKTIAGIIESLGDLREISLEKLLTPLVRGIGDRIFPVVEFLSNPQVQQNIVALGEALAQRVLPVLDLIAGSVVAVIDAFRELPQPIKDAIGEFGRFFTVGVALGGALIAVRIVLGGLLSPIGLLSAAIGGLAALWTSNFRNIQQATFNVINNITTWFNDLADQAVDWGVNIISALADGIVAAAGLVVQAISFIADIFTFWMAPGSPPRMLPDLTMWGKGAADAYLEGWQLADFNFIKTFAKDIGELLGGNKELEASLRTSFANLFDAALDGADFTQQLQNLVSIAGSAGEEAGRLAGLYIELARASREATQAQTALDDATASFDDRIKAVSDTIKNLQRQGSTAQDERTIAVLERLINSEFATQAQKEEAARRIALINAENELETLNEQKETATDRLSLELETAQLRQTTAQNELDIFRARIDVSNEQLSLFDKIANSLSTGGKKLKEQVGLGAELKAKFEEIGNLDLGNLLGDLEFPELVNPLEEIRARFEELLTDPRFANWFKLWDNLSTTFTTIKTTLGSIVTEWQRAGFEAAFLLALAYAGATYEQLVQVHTALKDIKAAFDQLKEVVSFSIGDIIKITPEEFSLFNLVEFTLGEEGEVFTFELGSLLKFDKLNKVLTIGEDILFSIGGIMTASLGELVKFDAINKVLEVGNDINLTLGTIGSAVASLDIANLVRFNALTKTLTIGEDINFQLGVIEPGDLVNFEVGDVLQFNALTKELKIGSDIMLSLGEILPVDILTFTVGNIVDFNAVTKSLKIGDDIVLSLSAIEPGDILDIGVGSIVSFDPITKVLKLGEDINLSIGDIISEDLVQFTLSEVVSFDTITKSLKVGTDLLLSIGSIEQEDILSFNLANLVKFDPITKELVLGKDLLLTIQTPDTTVGFTLDIDKVFALNVKTKVLEIFKDFALDLTIPGVPQETTIDLNSLFTITFGGAALIASNAVEAIKNSFSVDEKTGALNIALGSATITVGPFDINVNGTPVNELVAQLFKDINTDETLGNISQIQESWRNFILELNKSEVDESTVNSLGNLSEALLNISVALLALSGSAGTSALTDGVKVGNSQLKALEKFSEIIRSFTEFDFIGVEKAFAGLSVSLVTFSGEIAKLGVETVGRWERLFGAFFGSGQESSLRKQAILDLKALIDSFVRLGTSSFDEKLDAIREFLNTLRNYFTAGQVGVTAEIVPELSTEIIDSESTDVKENLKQYIQNVLNIVPGQPFNILTPVDIQPEVEIPEFTEGELASLTAHATKLAEQYNISFNEAFDLTLDQALASLNITTSLTDAEVASLANIAQGIVEGLLPIELFNTKFKDIVSEGLSTLKSELGIQSPSQVMYDSIGIPIAEGINNGIATLLELIVPVWEEFTLITTDAFTLLSESVLAIVDSMNQTMIEMIDLTRITIEGLIQLMADNVIATVVAMIEKLKQLIGVELVGWLRSDELVSQFRDAGYNIGNDIVSGIAAGMRGNIDAATGAVAALVSAIEREFRKQLGISSPSKVMAKQVGIPIGEGIMVGIGQALSSTRTPLFSSASMASQISNTTNNHNNSRNFDVNINTYSPGSVINELQYVAGVF